MWRATLRGIFARKVRLALSALAIVLGVAFVAGTFVLTDTLKASYGEVASQFATGSEIIVTPARGGFNILGFGRGGATVSDAIVPVIRNVPGVAAVGGLVRSDSVALLDANGTPIARGFNTQTQAISWPGDGVGPFVLRTGRAPVAPNEVLIDVATANQNGIRVGDSVQVAAKGGVARPYVVTGLLGLGTTIDLGALTYVAFDATTAQQLFDKPNQFDAIFVRTAPGADKARIVRDLQLQLGPDIIAIDTQAFAAQQAADTGDFFQFINRFILAFAALGVFVGGFIIANTFVILVQQRTRELALLRALGASGNQVRLAVIAEAMVLGLFASLVGFVAGIGLGAGAFPLLRTIGLDVPSIAPVVETRTFVWALIVGMVVTVASAIWPANRAASTAPIAAITDVRPVQSKPFLRPEPVDPPPPTRQSQIGRVVLGIAAGIVALVLAFAIVTAPESADARQKAASMWLCFWCAIVAIATVRRAARILFSRLIVALEFLGLGGFFITYALVGSFVQSDDAIVYVGVGCLTLFLGVVIGAALVARPIARMLGTRPVGTAAACVGLVIVGIGGFGVANGFSTAEMSPLRIAGALGATLAGLALLIAGPALFGTIGLLARGNAMRNPRRTATTASAVVVGMALISVVSVFTASAQQDARRAISSGVKADYVVNADGYAGFSDEVVDVARAVPAAQAAVALRFISGEVSGQEESIVGATLPGFADALSLDLEAGSIDGLASNGVLLADFRARELKVGVGDSVVLSVNRAPGVAVPVVGIYRNDRFTGQQPATVIVGMPLLAQLAPRATTDNQVFVTARADEVQALGEQLRTALRAYPTVKVRTFTQFLDDSLGFLASILNIFVGLLLFSLLIALLGIINTLLLSVYERTRELGLLRAIGSSRRQIRRMIRGEAVIIAVLGSVVGLGLGLIWARVFVAALAGSGFREFAVPWVQLGSYAALAAAAAVLASVIPAWRAGRLNVLEAIATE